MSDGRFEHDRRRRRGIMMPLLCLVTVAGVFSAVACTRAGTFSLVPRLQGAPPSVQHIAEQLARSVESSTKALEQSPTYPHIVSTNGATVHAKPVTFTFDGVEHTVAPAVSSSAYWGAKSASRDALVAEGTSPEQWSAEYYRSIALDPAQSSMLDSACSQLRAIARSDGLDRDQYLELIAKYVQSLTYDKKEWASGKAVVRFPVQTVVEGKGLCEDKSLLLVALLAHEGYATALLSFAAENHMAVGVKGPGATYGGTGYLFVETTQPCYIGEPPGVYDGGIRLTSEPQVVPIGNGTVTYSSASQVAQIVQARDTADAAAQALLARAKQQSLSYSQAAEVNHKLALAQQATTNLRSNVVDEQGDRVGHFLDRTQAIRWVRDNAWWL